MPPEVLNPQIRLSGTVGDDMLESFLNQLANVHGTGPIAVELMSTGGDADVGRRLALEVRLARARLNRPLYFVGKTTIYSAAVTIMSGFAKDCRFLSADVALLIHCRQLEMTVQLSGPLRGSAQRLKEVLSQINFGLAIEQEGFEALIAESDLTLEEVNEKAATNWYVTAHEALKHNLIAGII